MALPVRPDRAVPGTDDVEGPLDPSRLTVVRGLPSQPAGEVRVLRRVLEIPGRVGRIGVVRAPQLVADARVAEAGDEHAVPAGPRNERGEENVRLTVHPRDREAAERVPDDDVRR